MINQLNRFEATIIVKDVKWEFFAAAGNGLVTFTSTDATTGVHLCTNVMGRVQAREVIRDLHADV